MDSTKPAAEIAHDLSPTIKVYKDGRVERLKGNDIVPPSFDPKTNVDSKDVVYSPEDNLSARLYIPKNTNRNIKVPLLVYFHGGGFFSVDYRRAPEYPVPCAHEDSWTALKWVASHVNRKGSEDWLNHHADFQRVFLSGDSAGANIAHHMGVRLGRAILDGVNVIGIALIHPYFLGEDFIGSESTNVNKKAWLEGLWYLACPNTSGCDDPWINPVVHSSLATLGCKSVLIFVAEKDFLGARGWFYFEKLKESGWKGDVEIVESKGEDHVFHLSNLTSENAVSMLKRTASFFNQDKA